MHNYWRVVEISLHADDPMISSRMRTESRRSSNRTSRRSQSSVIRPMAPMQTADPTPPSQVAEPSQAALVVDSTPEEASGDSKSVSKPARVD